MTGQITSINGKSAEDIYDETIVAETVVGTEVFYLRSDRLWVAIAVNAEGHQVGDAEFSNSKKQAKADAARLAK